MKAPGNPVPTVESIRVLVRDFCASSPQNSLHNDANEPAWEAPLVGVSSGADPLYAAIKEAIGPFYWTPADIFRLQFPESEAVAEDLSVVSYILPQTAATRADQRRETTMPSERWARSRFYGEAFNNELRRYLTQSLESAGLQAVAPELSPHFGRRDSPRFGQASNWSERHVAHVSGLGTFGLSDGLITPLGKAVRCGSVVVRLPLPATSRPYGDHGAWCLWYARETCKACIPRCPVGAISPSGHDKERCRAYIRDVTTGYSVATYGVDVNNCGLCQVKIPCEAGIPAQLRE